MKAEQVCMSKAHENRLKGKQPFHVYRLALHEFGIYANFSHSHVLPFFFYLGGGGSHSGQQIHVCSCTVFTHCNLLSPAKQIACKNKHTHVLHMLM